MDMTRVFADMAGKRTPWFTIVHQNIVGTVGDIEKVYLSYAYFDMEGRIDMSQHSQEAAQKVDEWMNPSVRDKENQVLQIRHAVKTPKLTSDELMALQAKVSKDLGLAVNINMLLNTVT